MANARSSAAREAEETHQSLADDLQHAIGGEADAARIASGQPIEDATEATEAEVPASAIAHISDASLPSREEQAAALDRAMRKASGKGR